MTKGFYAIAVISNAARFKARVRLFKKFQEEMHQDGVKLIVVELAYGHRHFEVTEVGNPMHLQLRTNSEIWHKENLIALGVKHLYKIAPDWKYFAWVDADITFVKSHCFEERQNWVTETVHQLQHHQVVQLFQTALDLGPHGQCFATHQGFAWAYAEGRLAHSKNYTYYHPGYAWAMRREAWEHTGIIETAVLGSGDRHMAYAWVGMAKKSLQAGTTKAYAAPILAFEQRAEHFIKRDIGFVPGTILHHFHGKKKDRRYHDRWEILEKYLFDPVTDLKRNQEGLLELVVISHRQRELRDAIRKYFRSRNEDSIDME